MEVAKEHIEKLMCWLMDRGISPTENIKALEEVTKTLKETCNIK